MVIIFFVVSLQQKIKEDDMEEKSLISIVNEILKEWNPIGVPNEIADVEYIDYAPYIAQVAYSQNKIESCLISMLKRIGYNDRYIRNNIIIQQDIKNIAQKINRKYQSERNHEELRFS